jgi:hypothetical protein
MIPNNPRFFEKEKKKKTNTVGLDIAYFKLEIFKKSIEWHG